jgi:uncharacterized protein (TIGR03382 family)
MKKSVAVGVASLTLAGAGAQTIPYAGGAYTQNFNGLGITGAAVLTGRGPHALEGVLGASGVPGWYGANFGGSSTSTEVKAHDGSLASSEGRGVIYYGATGSGERALGALPTSNQISSFGAVFTNTTGQTLQEATIGFWGEQWRRGNVTTPNVLAFGYGLSSSIELATTPFSGLDFASVNMQASPTEVALDGNAAGNRAFITATIQDLNWAPGATLAIAWRINDISGQDNGLGIDDFEFSATVPAPGSLVLVLCGVVGLFRRRR